MMLAYLVVALCSTPISPKATPVVIEPAAIEQEGMRQLLLVRRVFVDRFSGGETAAQMRDMIISSLQNSKLFVITESQDRADTILRGSAEDLVFNEVHTSSDSLNVHSSLGTSTTDEAEALHGGTRTEDRSGRSMGVGAGDSESSDSV